MLQSIEERLRMHVEGTANADHPELLADCIWGVMHGKFFITQLPTAALLALFQELNSVIKIQPRTELFSRTLLYAVNGLMSLCLDYAASSSYDEISRKHLLLLGWQITTAWDAVLAGDIDDIIEHLELERDARAIEL